MMTTVTFVRYGSMTNNFGLDMEDTDKNDSGTGKSGQKTGWVQNEERV